MSGLKTNIMSCNMRSFLHLLGEMGDINFLLKNMVYSGKKDMTSMNMGGNDVIHLLVKSDGAADVGLTAVGRVVVVVSEGVNDAPVINYDFAQYVDTPCESSDDMYDEKLGLLGMNQR